MASFPPILTFTLNRFEFDLYTLTRQKITSEFKFPLVLDLNLYLTQGEGSENKNEIKNRNKKVKNKVKKKRENEDELLEVLESSVDWSDSKQVESMNDPNNPNIYHLFGVVIHQGQCQKGY